MKRRQFLQRAAAGGVLGAIASPALAQGEPSIRWRLAASWPKSLDTIFGSDTAILSRISQS